MDLPLPDLQLVDVPRWVDHAVLPVGGAEVVLDDGLLYPVIDAGDPERHMLGFVFLGEGDLSWAWHTDGEALSALGRLTTAKALDPQDARRALAERRSATRFDALVATGPDDAWRDWLADLPAVSVHGSSVSWTDDRGLEHLVVLDRALPGPGRARRTLDQRLRAWRLAGLDVPDKLAADAVRPGPPHTLMAVRPLGAWAEVGWLGWVRDPTGAVDDVYGQVLAAHARKDWQVLTGLPRDAPLARARVDHAEVRVAVSLQDKGEVVVIDVEAELSLVSDAPTPFVDLALPRRVDPLDHYALLPIRDKDPVLVGPDGAALAGAPWGRWPDRPDLATWRVWLPAPVGPDAPGSLTVRWTVRRSAEGWFDGPQFTADTAPGCERSLGDDDTIDAHLAACPSARVPRLALGPVTVGHALVPRILGQPGSFPTTMTASAALPEDWAVVVGGADSERRLSVGRGSLEVRSAPGLPTLRVLSRGSLDPGPAVVEVIRLMQRVLPDYPNAELTVVQGPDLPTVQLLPEMRSSRDRKVGANEPDGSDRKEPAGPVGKASPPSGTPLVPLARDDPASDTPSARPAVWRASGLVEVRGLVVLSQGPMAGRVRIDRDLLERELAGAIAADWWSELPWPRREAWLGRALPIVYRDLYAAWRFSPSQAADWAEEGKLSEDEQLGRLLGGALADRVGHAALLEALDRLRRHGPYTVEGLVQAVQAVDGTDLSGFLTPWLAATRGVMPTPRIQGTATVTEDGVTARLTSDLALGRLDVPIGLCRRKRCAVVWVSLVDGAGEATVAHRGRLDRVEVDPEAWLPLVGRRVRLTTDDDSDAPTR